MTTPNRYLSKTRYRVVLVSAPAGRPGWLGTFLDRQAVEDYVSEVASRMQSVGQPGALAVENLEPIS